MSDATPTFEDLVAPEWEMLQEALTAMRNAFGYFDDKDDLDWSAETWADAARAASRVEERAENLARAAWKVQREREDAAEDAAEQAA